MLIAAGRSKDGKGTFYPAGVLKASAPKFERTPAMAFVKLDASGKPLKFDHQADPSKSGMEVLNQIGFYESVRWDDDRQAIVGELVLPEGIGDPYQHLLESLEKANALDTVGLSIHAEGKVGTGRLVASIDQVFSVDLVSFPAAGGAIAHRLAASLDSPALAGTGGSTMNWFERLKKLVGERLCEGLTASDPTKTIATKFLERLKTAGEEAQTLSFLLGDLAALDNMDKGEAVKKLQACIDFIKSQGDLKESVTPPPAPPSTPASAASDDLAKRLQKAEADLKASRIQTSKQNLLAACAERKLTKDATQRLIASYKDREDLDEAKADEIAKGELEYLDRHIAGNAPVRLAMSREKGDLAIPVLANMMNPRCALPKDVRPMHSFHRFDSEFFGLDTRVTAQADRARLRESIDSTSFNQVYADALNRALLAEYVGNARLMEWRKLVRVVPVSDFRTRHVIKPGWYGFLPDVAAKAPYLPLTTPTDVEESAALAKKGGTETWAWEDRLNDDVGLVQKMISRLGLAAVETIFDHVLAIVRDATQPTLQDSLSLTSASRTGDINEGTAVLSADATGKTNYINSIKAMMQLKGGSGQKKGIRPRYIIIPFDKVEQLAYVMKELTGGVTGTDVPDAVKKLLGISLPEPIIDWGTGNATDWYLMADPLEATVIEMMFLDGREDPEIFIADDQRFGSMFTRDSIDLKIRHVYKAFAVDYAGIYGNDAAS